MLMASRWQLRLIWWQLRLIWWKARVDWRGERLPTPPTQPHPPDPPPENHLPKPLARWATPYHFSSDLSPLEICSSGKGNIWKCVREGPDAQLASLGPSFLPLSSFNSHHLFSSFISHFTMIECNNFLGRIQDTEKLTYPILSAFWKMLRNFDCLFCKFDPFQRAHNLRANTHFSKIFKPELSLLNLLCESL